MSFNCRYAGVIFLLRLYVVQSNDQKAADLIHSLIEFLTNFSAKTYQSWLYSDLKGISTESTEKLLEVPLADARKLEEAIANRNYIFFILSYRIFQKCTPHSTSHAPTMESAGSTDPCCLRKN